jgi:hypothetical protein
MSGCTVPIYTFLCVSLAVSCNVEVHGSNLYVPLFVLWLCDVMWRYTVPIYTFLCVSSGSMM